VSGVEEDSRGQNLAQWEIGYRAPTRNSGGRRFGRGWPRSLTMSRRFLDRI